MASQSLQRLRLTVGLWVRMAVAVAIAAPGFVLLLLIEAVAIAAMTLFLLAVAPVAIGVLLLLIGLWVAIAGLYRRLMPAPLVVGRISSKWLTGIERFAHAITNPRDGGELRSLAPLLGALVAWFVGRAIVEYTTLVTPFEAGIAISAGVGVVGTVYYTGRTIDDELGRGGTVEAQLEDDIDVVESDAADEVLANTTDLTLDELQARVDRLANQAAVPAPTVRIGRERQPFAATVGFRPGTSTIVVSYGLCSALSDRELEAVLAHELAHVVNRDAAILTALSLPDAKFDALLEAAVADPNEDSAHPIQAVQAHPMVVLLAFPIVGFTRAAHIVVTRYREYVADRGAVAIAGDPAALASALETLDTELERRPSSDLREHGSTAAFSIVPPPWEEHRFFDRTRRLISRRLLGTHPPTENRIERLRESIDDSG